MESLTFFELLQSGGDMALVAIAWAIYRIERRVFKIELKLLNQGENNEKMV